MGMYTGLRVKAIVKPIYFPMIQAIDEGANWSEFVDEFPFLSEYADMHRATFIPRGALCYMPDSWDNDVNFARSLNEETGKWTFQCSLKNYESEIECFLDTVLPHLIDSAEHIESLYEEASVSTVYDFVDGKITKSVEREGIRYSSDVFENSSWY